VEIIKPYPPSCRTESQCIAFRIRERALRLDDFNARRISFQDYYRFINASHDELAPAMAKARTGIWENGVPPWSGENPSDFWDGRAIVYHPGINMDNKASKFGFVLWVAAIVKDPFECNMAASDLAKVKHECSLDTFWDKELEHAV
jgi:hypothetical protein